MRCLARNLDSTPAACRCPLPPGGIDLATSASFALYLGAPGLTAPWLADLL